MCQCQAGGCHGGPWIGAVEASSRHLQHEFSSLRVSFPSVTPGNCHAAAILSTEVERRSHSCRKRDSSEMKAGWGGGDSYLVASPVSTAHQRNQNHVNYLLNSSWPRHGIGTVTITVSCAVTFSNTHTHTHTHTHVSFHPCQPIGSGFPYVCKTMDSYLSHNSNYQDHYNRGKSGAKNGGK